MGPAARSHKKLGITTGESTMDDGFMVMASDKKIERIDIRVSDTLFRDLARMAHLQDRKVSDYVRHVVELHLYGAARLPCPDAEDH
jgi:hypothetical protein